MSLVRAFVLGPTSRSKMHASPVHNFAADINLDQYNAFGTHLHYVTVHRVGFTRDSPKNMLLQI